MISTVVKPSAYELPMFAYMLIKLDGLMFVSMHHPRSLYSFMLPHHALECMFVFMLITLIFILIILIILIIMLFVVFILMPLIALTINISDVYHSTHSYAILMSETIGISKTVLQSECIRQLHIFIIICITPVIITEPSIHSLFIVNYYFMFAITIF